MKKTKKPLIFGLIGSAILLVIYFSILIIANSFSHAVGQFTEMWYWILILVIGFGTQVGLYSYIRASMHANIAGATAEVATAGGISTGSMVACCAHHLVDTLPFLGLSAAALFLNKYQVLFFVIGILSNLIGINLMLNIIQKHSLYDRGNKILSKILKFDMKKSLYYTSSLSLVIILGTLYYLI